MERSTIRYCHNRVEWYAFILQLIGFKLALVINYSGHFLTIAITAATGKEYFILGTNVFWVLGEVGPLLGLVVRGGITKIFRFLVDEVREDAKKFIYV